MADNKQSKAYNELLVEFNFAIDLDMALFKYIILKYGNSSLVDERLSKMRNEYHIIRELLYRQDINPLSILIPGQDTNAMYEDLMENHEAEILQYAKPCDILLFMHTLKENASSTNITIICKNKTELRWLKKYTSLRTIVAEPGNFDISRYTVLYIKFLKDALKYGSFGGKYIYTAAARYNFMPDEQHLLYLPTVAALGDVNIIKLIDPYVKVKFAFKGDNKEDEKPVQ